MKMIILIFIIILNATIVLAGTYGCGLFGSGTYGTGDCEVLVDGGGGSSGAAGKQTISPSAKKASTPYYDIIIDNIKPVYNLEEVINATIIIINKGDVPDRDANLTYYLSGPENIIHSQSRETFEEIPETCPNATFMPNSLICEYPNSTTFPPLSTVLHRQLALPLNTTKGEWQFYVEYATEVQPVITVYKSFRVGTTTYATFIVILLILILSKFIGKKINED